MEWLTTLLQALQDPANYVDALTLGAIYALIAVGYTMVYGIIKLINFAHGEVIMLGAYIGLLCVTHFNAPLVLAIILAMGGCALVGSMLDWTAYLPLRRALPLPEWTSLIGLLLFAVLAIGWFSASQGDESGPSWMVWALSLTALLLVGGSLAELFGVFGPPTNRRSSDRLSALITAIGMSLSLQTIAQLLWTSNYRSFPEESVPGFFNEGVVNTQEEKLVPASDLAPSGELLAPAPDAVADGEMVAVMVDVPLIQGKELVTWIAAIVLMAILLLIVHKTRIGKAMRACAEDQQTAALMGINVNHVIAFTFMIGSAMAAVAGILYSLKVGGNISPRMGYYPGVIAFAAAVLGGIGNIFGAVLGGLIIGFTEVFGGTVKSEYDKAFAFGLMVVFILFRPRGLLGRKEAKRA